MAFPILAVAAVFAVASGVSKLIGGSKARAKEKKAAKYLAAASAIEKNIADQQYYRDVDQAIRAARITRARVENVSTLGNVGDSSGAQGAQSSLQSQLQSNLGFANFRFQAGTVAYNYKVAANNYLQKATDIKGTYGDVAGVFSLVSSGLKAYAGLPPAGGGGNEPQPRTSGSFNSNPYTMDATQGYTFQPQAYNFNAFTGK